MVRFRFFLVGFLALLTVGVSAPVWASGAQPAGFSLVGHVSVGREGSLPPVTFRGGRTAGLIFGLSGSV
ncbi:MAG: hypothetical protein P8X51_15835 [Maritimibacter sp.]